ARALFLASLAAPWPRLAADALLAPSRRRLAARRDPAAPLLAGRLLARRGYGPRPGSAVGCACPLGRSRAHHVRRFATLRRLARGPTGGVAGQLQGEDHGGARCRAVARRRGTGSRVSRWAGRRSSGCFHI